MVSALSVIIPALNEEKGIGTTVDRIFSVLKKHKISFEVIVVDDGSTDKTAQISKKKGARVISHKVNRGYGAALQTGFANARYEVCCTLDADATYPPEEIPKLLKVYQKEGADIVSGSRLMGANKGMPLLRKVGNKFFARLGSFLSGKKIHDASTGMEVISKKTLNSLLPLSTELDFTVKMTIKAVTKGLVHKEVPIRYDAREGDSKLRPHKEGILFLKTILSVVRDYRPLRFFLPLSFLFILIGIISALNLLYRRIEFGLSGEITNGLVISVFFLLFGFQLLAFGVIADMIAELKRG